MPLSQAIDLYIDATGGELLPSRREVARLAREWDIAVQEPRGATWAEHLAAVRAARSARGRLTPARIATPHDRPTLPRPAGLIGREHKKTSAYWKNEQVVIEAIAPFVSACQSTGEPPTRGRYLSWRKTNPDTPAASTIEKRHTFLEWIQMAEDHLLEQKKAGRAVTTPSLLAARAGSKRLTSM